MATVVDIGLDDEGDLALSGGDLALVSGRVAIAQRLAMRFRLWRGEWFADLRAGCDYRSIFVKGPNMTRIAADLKELIVSTPGVLSLDAFTLDLDRAARRLILSFQVSTEDGQISATGQSGEGLETAMFILLFPDLGAIL